MAEFRGPKNLHVGDWAKSVYDAEQREYVIELDTEGAKKFRALKEPERYGFTEAKAAAKADSSDA